jgi:hypothetical protein
MFDKKQEKIAYESKPPNLIETLASIIGRARIKPKMFPTDYRGGAQFWIDRQEPANEYAEKVEKREENGKSFWTTPYYDRVAGNLKLFLAMTPMEQMFIIDGIESGVPWRGDSIEMYKMITVETQRMLLDRPAYIEEALVKMKNFRFNVVDANR